MKFDTLFEKYLKLLKEEDIPDMGAPSMDQGGMGGQPPQQPQQPVVPAKPASASYVYLVNVMFEALKTKKPMNISAMKYSDNKAENSNEAFKYIEMVINNLPPQTRNKLQNDVKNAGDFNDIDEGNIVDMANLGIKSLFSSDKNSTEYFDIVNEPNVTPENAVSIYNKISRFFSTE